MLTQNNALKWVLFAFAAMLLIGGMVWGSALVPSIVKPGVEEVETTEHFDLRFRRRGEVCLLLDMDAFPREQMMLAYDLENLTFMVGSVPRFGIGEAFWRPNGYLKVLVSFYSTSQRAKIYQRPGTVTVDKKMYARYPMKRDVFQKKMEAAYNMFVEFKFLDAGINKRWELDFEHPSVRSAFEAFKDCIS